MQIYLNYCYIIISIFSLTLRDWYWDTFEKTPPMATYSLAILISEFSYLSTNISDDESEYLFHSSNKLYRFIISITIYIFLALVADEVQLRIWARPEFINSLRNVTEKIEKSLIILENFWKMPYPLPKLDIFALPNFQATRPADGWGVLIFK